MSNSINIGVSGKEGSFSEEAALMYCQRENIKDYTLKYLVSVENVLSALDSGEINIGIFPIENSNGGIVIEAVYAMAKHKFAIKKIFEIEIHHNLLALPGVKAEEIATITSHDQALKQCRMYLSRTRPGVTVEEYADTAKA